VVNQRTVASGAPDGTGVACPSGSVVTGGGLAGNGTNLFFYNSSGTGNGWEAYAQNTSGSGQLLNAYAICLSNTAGTSQQVLAQASVPGSSAGNATAACPSGSFVTGGGFAGNNNLFVYNSSISGNGWQVYAQNNSGSSQTLNAYAICLSGTSGSSQQVFAQTTIAAGDSNGTSVACPSGTWMTGGGFAIATGLFLYNTSATGNGWETYAQNTTGSGQLLNTYAICSSF
jgi:hypothetical protein